MLTVGVDLSAEPAGTAIASVLWSSDQAVVKDLVVGADDDRILDMTSGADKVGIDCPLGWPAAFVSFVNAHHTGHIAVPSGGTGREWRRSLALRATDLVVNKETGIWPLSVAAERIAYTAMRTAGLLARLAAAGRQVDRRGHGVVVEVYPAASLRRWKLPHRRFKGARNRGNLSRAVDLLSAEAPWLTLGPYETLCRTSDHAFDAVIAALTAYAAARGLTYQPDPANPDLAHEGWIALPTCELGHLLDTSEPL